MKYIKTYEIKKISNYDFKVGDIVKLIGLAHTKKLNSELNIDIKKNDLCEIVNFNNYDPHPFRLMPLKYKNRKISFYWDCDFWVSRKQITKPTEFELDMIKYNL